MKEFNKENAKLQCFNCRSITKPSEWVQNINENNPKLSTFICPRCLWEHMSDKLMYIPDGKKVVVRAMTVTNSREIALEYDVYLAEEVMPFYKLKENPIRDYSDYIDGEPFFKTEEEMKNALCKENILGFIKENHPELIKHIENKGFYLYPAWIPYEELI